MRSRNAVAAFRIMTGYGIPNGQIRSLSTAGLGARRNGGARRTHSLIAALAKAHVSRR
jgi:hypothetical protein